MEHKSSSTQNSKQELIELRKTTVWMIAGVIFVWWLAGHFSGHRINISTNGNVEYQEWSWWGFRRDFSELRFFPYDRHPNMNGGWHIRDGARWREMDFGDGDRLS